MTGDLIPANVLATHTIANVSETLAEKLGLPQQYRSIGIITADSDDVTYCALDEATKAAAVEVVYGRSLYAGAGNASTKLAGEVIGILAGPNPAEVQSGLRACAEFMASGVGFRSANEDGSIVYFAHTVSRTGTYLSKTAGVREGEALAYLIAPPLEAVVGLDEAYVDFGGESCVSLTGRYPNLLVVQTYSKSRSMAGARLGYAIGDAALIQDLETIKFSTNPYNVNRLTLKAGAQALAEQAYYDKNCQTIMETRAYTARELEKLGFTVLPSQSNFLFARKPGTEGADVYRRLKERGVLVRHFDKERIRDYNRITIGTREQMDILLEKLREFL